MGLRATSSLLIGIQGDFNVRFPAKVELYRLFLFALLTSPGLFGQSFTATIRGVITDATSAAIPNAQISLRETNRNIERKTVTDTEGRYVITALPPGNYALSAESAGFSRLERPGIELQVQQQATLDLVMTVGEISSSVSVEATAPLVNSTSAQLGQVVENRFLVSLPLIGRNAMSLVALAPSITPVNTSANGQTSTNFTANGTRNSTADVLLDGMSLTNVEQNSGITELKYFPSVDAVQEFKVQTNALSAEFGNTGGAIVNSILKSGTNEFHGTAYEFHRNSALNANDWFSNRANRSIPDFKRNLFGGNVGGPVWIPKIYDGHDKTFFFVTYEGIRQQSAVTRTATVPTLLERMGDFSETRASNGQLITIYNPFDVMTTANGPRRTPFPGNQVPANLLDPIAVKALTYYPAPTSEGNPFTHTNNFFAQGVNISRSNQMDFKGDHIFSDKTRIAGRYSRNRNTSLPANLWGNEANRFTDGDSFTHTQNGVMDITRAHSPTLLLTARFGVLRVDNQRNPHSLGFDQTTLGLPSFFLSSGIKLFPSFSPEGYQAMGTNGYALIGRGEDVTSTTFSATKIAGGHTVKMGYEGRFMRLNYLQPGYPQGNFNFNRQVTSENPFAGNSLQGNGVASMLLGWGSGGDYHLDPWSASASKYFGFYVQDDWKVTRKLTLNLGLRYDFDLPRTERYNRYSWFDPDAPSPIAGQVAQFPDLKGAFRFTDDETRSPVNGDHNNWQPRIGFAYAPDARTAIRGAYGIQYTLSRATIKGHLGSGFATNSNPEFTRDGGLTPYASLSNPFPNGLTIPPGTSQGAATFLGLGIGTETRPNQNPQYQLWNLSVQREVGFNSVMEVNYVGTKGTHLYFGGGVEALNRLDPSYWGIGRTELNSNVPNPFYGVITDPKSPLSTPTTQLQRLLRPYPQYTGVSGSTPNIGNSIYHAMQLRFEKRYSRGLTLVGHYTWSKLIDDASFSAGNVAWLGGTTSVQNYKNLRLERSLSSMDISHRAVISFDYQVPLGRGRAVGANMNRVVNAAVGGWSVSGLATISAGYPIIPLLQGGVLWEGTQRPNLLGDPSTSGAVQDRLNGYLNPAAFSRPAADTFGSSPRTLNYRTPGVRAFDFGLMKRFYVTEARFFEFRGEAQNFLNHPVFGTPNATFGDTNFGVISSTAGGPRELQLGLKFIF